ALFACSPDEPIPAETTAQPMVSSPSTTATTTTALPEDDLTEAETVFSSELYCDDAIAVWTTPRDNVLVCVDLQSGAQTVLSQGAVSPQFFVVGNRVIFYEQGSGRICAVNTDGGDYISYYQMPLSDGVMKNGVLYFIEDDDDFSTETVLYQYEPKAGIWSKLILPGSHRSPVYERVVFGDDSLYYIASDDSGERVVRQSLDNGDRRVIYQVDSQASGCVLELIYSAGSLYFRDSNAALFFVYNENDDSIRSLNVPGERVCAVMANGLITQSKAVDGDSLILSNAAEQSAEFQGGVVETIGVSRALVRRTTAEGRDLLALVKYPEDAVQGEITGEILRIVTDRNGHAVVFLYGESVCYYVDLNNGTMKEYPTDTKYLNRVSLARYITLDSIEHTVLSGHDLVEAEPQQIAEAFAKALNAGDRLSLAILLYDYGPLSAFMPFVFDGWELIPAASMSPEEKYVCRLNYTPYTEGDLSILDYAPEILRIGRLTLVSDGNCWMITKSEVRTARSR
ncbi:MAG: hypothetical protein IKU55_05335, partial [Clostridia bacterium]|nr:hypothetical protein [Clostridia bacterium]